MILGAACYLELGEFDNALEDSLKCVDLCKDFTKGFFRLSNSYYYLEKYNEAIDTLDKFDKSKDENDLISFRKKVVDKQDELIYNEKSMLSFKLK